METEKLLHIRSALQEHEQNLVRMSMSNPTAFSEEQLDGLRYILSFARLTILRGKDGKDYEVFPFLTAHRTWVSDIVGHIFSSTNPVEGFRENYTVLVEETLAQRRKVLHHFPIERVVLEKEVCERQLVLVLGGGGGGGYGYTGILQLLSQYSLSPSLISGTSIGALVGMFRARSAVYDPLPMFEAAKRLRWNTVFRILEMNSRYGVPATLRLYLRAALGSMFHREDGGSMRFSDCPIPLLVVTTGLTMEAFKHDMSYYEHLMDGAISEGFRFGLSGLRKIRRGLGILQEFLSLEESLKEVVFGLDPHTQDAEILDAAGFSAAVPGLIHYDIIREAPHMHQLLDRLYAEYGITRLGEGGLVNNVPAKPAFQAVMQGAIQARNPFILALDCFSPQPTSLMWYPIQQLVARNVRANMPYMGQYIPLTKRLMAVNVVPNVEQITKAMNWTMAECTPHMPFISRMCQSHPILNELR